MPYALLEKTYDSLTEEQQLIVYNLAVTLMNMNQKEEKTKLSKEKEALDKLFALADSMHLTSNGQRWTREELYER